MKYIIIGLLVVLGLSACSTHNPNGSYERANAASEKSLNGLDRDTQ